jgi:hypothetical protein
MRFKTKTHQFVSPNCAEDVEAYEIEPEKAHHEHGRMKIVHDPSRSQHVKTMKGYNDVKQSQGRHISHETLSMQRPQFLENRIDDQCED